MSDGRKRGQVRGPVERIGVLPPGGDVALSSDSKVDSVAKSSLATTSPDTFWAVTLLRMVDELKLQ